MNKYALSFKSPAEILKYIEEQDIQFIDLNFTDIRGKWQHTTQHASAFTKELIDDGACFDGSSIAGWCDIQKSDMIIKPDISRVTYDPFAAQKTIKIFCDIYEPTSKKPYSRDPRSVAKAAEAYLKKSKLGDTAYFGPEPEFFIFDDVRVHTDTNHVSYMLDSEEGAYNKGRDYPTGNMGHRPPPKGGYFPESPVDSLSDIRAEMLTVIESMGVSVEKHHHEVAPAQCELGIKFASLLETADNVQLYKHAVHNVAHSYGKSATFMPKPINDDNGSGMHVHQSLWKSGKPLFAGKSYANLSETALYYIGGILKHARALNAFTNPTTNSYKRLVAGFEAPVSLTYSALNRSAACRIPHTNAPKERRIEARFPDPLANPYLAFSAMLMAGLDGIENKIHPGDAADKDLYTVSSEEQLKVPKLCGSLKEALIALESDHDFLLKGDVFTRDLIDAFIDLKIQEIAKYEAMVHPVEVDMYYSG
ncbi:MAG: type I glutamate--ammonia ligase [Alphaproteobacteria bacterium]|nr:MAG: type I glutamate--ammonia ligase [Alphaproteobacteria bacterium]